MGYNDGHMACGVLSHADSALTWEGDIAVRALKPEGDVGAAGGYW
jgi:hypothetical protein